MIKTAKTILHLAIRQLGYEIVPVDVARQSAQMAPGVDQSTIEICRYVQPFTMTSTERIYALCKSIEYIVRNDIAGDIVECGVWKGGSMMAVARTLMDLRTERTLYLFDTFEGMSEPTECDRDYMGRRASDRMSSEDKATSWVWAYCPI